MSSVFVSSLRIVNGVGVDDDEEMVVLIYDDFCGVKMIFDNGLDCFFGYGDFGGEKGWGD